MAKKEPKPKTPEDLEKEEQDEEDDEEFDEDDEEFESEVINPGTSASFRYPFLRRMPTIRIQPITAPIEVELGDVPTQRKEEDNADQYKPVNLEKNYSLNQKYELPGGASYEKITPKTVSAPVSPSLDANFQEQTTRGFGVQSPSAPGYPGQESSERKYDSGLEQQTRERERDRERRRSMWKVLFRYLLDIKERSKQWIIFNQTH